MSFRLPIAGRMASEVLPAGRSVRRGSTFSEPPLFISPRFFNRLDESSKTPLAGGFGRMNSRRSRASTRNWFSRKRARNRRGRTMYPPPLPAEKFFRVPASGRSKTSLHVIGVDVGVSVSASATRASFLFCRHCFPGRTFLSHFYPSSLPLRRFFPCLFAVDRGSSLPLFRIPSSFIERALRRV